MNRGKYSTLIFLRFFSGFSPTKTIMPGVLQDVDRDIPNARKFAVFLILFSAYQFVADFPGGLLHHPFASMVNYTIFTLGMMLLFPSVLFPHESVSQVAKKLVSMAAEHCRLSLDAASRAGSLVGEIAYMILAKMKKIFKVLILITTVAVFGIVADLAVRFPHKFLSVAHVLTNFNFASFIMGISFLLLFILFTKVPVSVVLAKKLVSAAAGLLRICHGRKSDGTFPFVIIAALGIFANLIVPHHNFISIALIAIFLTLAVTLHYILFLWVSVSVNVAKKLV